jgi:hypothetical protein
MHLNAMYCGQTMREVRAEGEGEEKEEVGSKLGLSQIPTWADFFFTLLTSLQLFY